MRGTDGFYPLSEASKKMDAIPEGEGCSFDIAAIVLIVLLVVIVLIPGFSWMVKLGLGFIVSVLLIGAFAIEFWSHPQ